MHPDHATLLTELKRLDRSQRHPGGGNDSYGGSGRPFYFVGVPERRAMLRRWTAANKKASAAEVLALVESLSDGESHEEKTLAAMLLGVCPKARAEVTPADLDRWLGKIKGWAEVDTFCQNLFPAEQMLADWPAWRTFLDGLSLSPNINKRRAAMVLLNAPVHYTDDPRFADLAFIVLERLKGERDILITKAVSWLLRSMAARHRAAVERYLAAEAKSLPAIALRETKVKLATGTKSGRHKSG